MREIVWLHNIQVIVVSDRDMRFRSRSVKVFRKVRVSSSIQLILSLSVNPSDPINPFKFLFIFIRQNFIIDSYQICIDVVPFEVLCGRKCIRRFGPELSIGRIVNITLIYSYLNWYNPCSYRFYVHLPLIKILRTKFL